MTTMAHHKFGIALTAREQEVLALLTKGLSNKLIADQLDISDHTAKFHVNNVCKKLGASTRVEAAVIHATTTAYARGYRAASERYATPLASAA